MSLKKKILIIFLVCVISVIFAACGIVAYAYFSKKDIYDGYFSGQVELLFDRLNDNGITNYNGANTDKVDKTKTWGSKEYPYVISDVRHLYNLSELQRLGYFDKKFISLNPEGSYSNIPYFLVCTPDYTPALIDGSKFNHISSIGTDEFPFIGSVKGVKDTATTVTVNGKACDTSAICNVQVAGNPNNVDVGLFGTIGYLGTPIEPTEQNPTPTFEGQISTVSNLVLSDVQIEVKSSSWDAVTSFVEDIMIALANNRDGGHKYSYSELHGTTDYDKVPHENHHIGILAGHAAYTKIEFISVYYSKDDIVAIDLNDETAVSGTKANYLSATGILGYIDNINPTVDKDGKITAGSGDSLGDISYNPVGGGGEASGNKAGYVLAVDMYEKFHYTKDGGEDTSGTIKLKDALDENGNALCKEWIRDRILWGTQNTGEYYFYDGVFTFALSDQADEIEPTWDIVVDENGNPVLDESGNFTYDVPEFSIGQDNDSAWKTNTAKGNKAVVAYVKKVTSDAALQEAITAGDKIFIMQEDQENLFLMSLYNQSTKGSGDFEEKYTTPGTTQKFASEDLVNGLITAYRNGELKLPTGDENDMTAEYDTEEKIAQALDEDTIKAINVGIISGSVGLDVLKQQYKITPAVAKDDNDKPIYTFFSGDTPVVVNDGTNGTAGTIQKYYDYATSDYVGYLYFAQVKDGLTTTNYEYFWQSLDGTSELIGEGVDKLGDRRDSNLPEEVFIDTGNTWNDEKIYTFTKTNEDGTKTTYKGVVVNKSEGTFYNSGNKANANGNILTKPITGGADIYYFYKDVGTEEYRYSTDNNTDNTTYTNLTVKTITNADGTTTQVTSPSGKPIYTTADGSKEGVLLIRYPTYTFSAQYTVTDANGKTETKTNYLRLIEATFTALGTHYVLWNGIDDNVTPDNFKTSFGGLAAIVGENITPSSLHNSTAATVRFNGGKCYIQYTTGSTGLYVNSTGSVFNTATSNGSTGTKLCIYTVEGTQDIRYGRITFDPIDDTTSTTDNYTFSAGTHVLLATSSHDRDANSNNITKTTTAYELKALTDLKDEKGNTWNNGLGTHLSQADLQSKFKMTKGITFGASFNLFNGTLGTSGIITAPVGTEGVEANIPQGCIAFRINKPVEAAKIRVIVSVAVSEYYPGEKDGDKVIYDLGDYTRYFNLWKMEQAGESMVQIFNATGENLLDRFEIPRSHPYEPGKTPANSEYITVKYNDTDYRCYLNGDRVLIAYEFTVNSTTAGTGTGVYCLGMSGINTDGSTQGDVPMEIVYFSADGVASAGRDGENNSQLGTIDFVYDYNNTVVTVTESSTTVGEGTDAKEDYSTYYPSYCLLYFDTTQKDTNSAYIPVNNEVVKIYRCVEETADSDINHKDTPSLSTLRYNLGGDKRVVIVQYSRFADNVRQKDVALEETTPATG